MVGRGVGSWFSVALAWLLLLGAPGHAADLTLQLKNGDRVSGQFISEADDRIRLQHPVLGTLIIPVNEVAARITPASPPPASQPPTPPPPSPAPSVTPTKAPAAAAPRRWTFDLQAGLDLGFGASDRQLYNSRARITYAKNRLRNTFDYMFTFGEANGTRSANRMDGMLKTDYEIGRRLFLYDLGGVGYDALRRIDLRYEVGPGIGYHVLRQEKLKLNIELGANYQVHQFKGGTESDSFFYRLAEDAIWQITPKLGFDQKFEFFPGLTDFEQFRFRFEGSLRYALRSNLYLNLTALDIYDNQPAASVSKNDVQLRSSIGLKF